MTYRNKNLLFTIAIVMLSIFVENLFHVGHHSVLDITGSIICLLFAAGIGILFYILVGSKITKWFDNKIKIELDKDELLIFESLAIHNTGRLLAAEGKLFLTDKRLFFKSYKFNFKNHEISINLTDIIGIHPWQRLLPINKGFIIQTKESSNAKFIVDKLDEWFAYFATKNYIIPSANKL